MGSKRVNKFNFTRLEKSSMLCRGGGEVGRDDCLVEGRRDM